MAVLPENNRRQVWRALIRYWSNEREITPFIKETIFDSVTAIDAFLDSNTAAINLQFDLAFRNNATPAQKALLVAFVTLARHDPELLRRIVGEID